MFQRSCKCVECKMAWSGKARPDTNRRRNLPIIGRCGDVRASCPNRCAMEPAAGCFFDRGEKQVKGVCVGVT
jgi:hypothetical protein